VNEIRRTTLCDANAAVPFRPNEHLRHLGRIFDAFLEHVATRLPELTDPLRDMVGCRFRSMGKDTDRARGLAGFEPLLPPLDDLQRSRLEYVLDLLHVHGDAVADEIDVTRIDLTRARLLPMYYQMLSLCDLIGRTEAIPFVEAYVDRWMAEQTRTDNALEDPGRFWDALEAPVHETGEIGARLHRGKIAFRVDRCLWADVMQPLGDAELSHAFTCYGDFPQIAAINPNFVLTRTMTLMQGAPYCDTCIHDRRHVSSIEHPSREFFESLGVG
jgi:hypothetical protein